MSLAAALLAAMMEHNGDRSSIHRDSADAKLKANKDKLLPKLNVLKESGEGLVHFVNFVEVLRRQLKSGGLRLGNNGFLSWQLLETLNDRRNNVLKTVKRHRPILTNTTMAETVNDHLEDFNDAVLFTEEDFIALHWLINVQASDKKNPTVTRKRLPHCKMASYFHVLTILHDAFKTINIFDDDDE